MANASDEREKFKKNLDQPEQWVEMNQGKVNKQKCKMLHLDRKNVRHKYQTVKFRFFSGACERLVGMFVNHNLSMSRQSNADSRQTKAIWGAVNIMYAKIQSPD